MIRLEIYNRCW